MVGSITQVIMADHNSAHAHLELRLVVLSKYKHTVFLFTDNTCGHLKWVTLGLSDHVVVVVVVCRDPPYSGSTAYADLGNIYSLY